MGQNKFPQNGQTHSNNTNCMNVFHHFVGLALKLLNLRWYGLFDTNHFEGCLLQIILDLFFNILSHIAFITALLSISSLFMYQAF